MTSFKRKVQKVSETLDNLDKETMRKWVVTQRMGRGNGGYFPFAKDFMNKLSFDQTITHPFFFFLTQNDGLNGYTFCWLVLPAVYYLYKGRTVVVLFNTWYFDIKCSPANAK